MPPDAEEFISVQRADALLEMGRRLLDGGRLPKVAGERPHVTLVVTRETADLEWGGVIPRETCHRYLCDCELTVVEAGAGGRPLSIGRRGRKVPLYLRKAVIARDRGCKFPGCDRPTSWCDCHHLIPWEEGGETALDNLVLLCRRHHRHVHEQGWRVFWGEQGELVAMPPLLGVAAGP